MANKIVIVAKGQTTGVEYPLDVDTGTDLRGLCYEGGGFFWAQRDPNLLVRYHLDVPGNTLRKLTTEGGTSTGFDSAAWGICTDGFNLFINNHNFRSGTHKNNVLQFTKAIKATALAIAFDTSASDNSNRFKGMDYDGEQLLALYQVNGDATNTRLVRLRFNTGNTGENLNIQPSGMTGICIDEQGGGFWTIDASNVIRHFNKDGNEMTTDQATLTHSGTARDLCNLGDGRFAVSMT